MAVDPFAGLVAGRAAGMLARGEDQRQKQQRLNQLMEESIAAQPSQAVLPAVSPLPNTGAVEKTLGAVGAVGNLFDVPGSVIRDLSTWLPGGTPAQNPVDQLLPWNWTDSENRVDGIEMLENVGLYKKGEDESRGLAKSAGRFAGGLALEIALDPLTYLSGGATAAMKGASKGAKAARAAYKSGLLDDLAETASKKAGKKVGKREALFDTTAEDLTAFNRQKRGTSRAASVVSRRERDFGNAVRAEVKDISKKQVDELAKEKMTEGYFRFRLPFGVIDKSFGGKGVASAMDKAGDFTRFGNPAGLLAGRVFSKASRNSRTAAGQRAAIQESKLLAENQATARYRVAPAVRAIAETKAFEGTPEEANEIGNAMYRYMEDIGREGREVTRGEKDAVESIQFSEPLEDYAARSEFDALREKGLLPHLDTLKEESGVALAMAQDAGVPIEMLDDSFASYAARSKNIERTPSRRAKDKGRYEPKTDFATKRGAHLRNYAGGTAELQEMSLDTDFAGILNRKKREGYQYSKNEINGLQSDFAKKYELDEDDPRLAKLFNTIANRDEKDVLEKIPLYVADPSQSALKAIESLYSAAGNSAGLSSFLKKVAKVPDTLHKQRVLNEAKDSDFVQTPEDLEVVEAASDLNADFMYNLLPNEPHSRIRVQNAPDIDGQLDAVPGGPADLGPGPGPGPKTGGPSTTGPSSASPAGTSPKAPKPDRSGDVDSAIEKMGVMAIDSDIGKRKAREIYNDLRVGNKVQQKIARDIYEFHGLSKKKGKKTSKKKSKGAKKATTPAPSEEESLDSLAEYALSGEADSKNYEDVRDLIQALRAGTDEQRETAFKIAQRFTSPRGKGKKAPAKKAPAKASSTTQADEVADVDIDKQVEKLAAYTLMSVDAEDTPWSVVKDMVAGLSKGNSFQKSLAKNLDAKFNPKTARKQTTEAAQEVAQEEVEDMFTWQLANQALRYMSFESDELPDAAEDVVERLFKEGASDAELHELAEVVASLHGYEDLLKKYGNTRGGTKPKRKSSKGRSKSKRKDGKPTRKQRSIANKLKNKKKKKKAKKKGRAERSPRAAGSEYKLEVETRTTRGDLLLGDLELQKRGARTHDEAEALQAQIDDITQNPEKYDKTEYLFEKNLNSNVKIPAIISDITYAMNKRRGGGAYSHPRKHVMMMVFDKDPPQYVNDIVAKASTRAYKDLDEADREMYDFVMQNRPELLEGTLISAKKGKPDVVTEAPSAPPAATEAVDATSVSKAADDAVETKQGTPKTYESESAKWKADAFRNRVTTLKSSSAWANASEGLLGAAKGTRSKAKDKAVLDMARSEGLVDQYGKPVKVDGTAKPPAKVDDTAKPTVASMTTAKTEGVVKEEGLLDDAPAVVTDEVKSRAQDLRARMTGRVKKQSYDIDGTVAAERTGILPGGPVARAIDSAFPAEYQSIYGSPSQDLGALIDSVRVPGQSAVDAYTSGGSNALHSVRATIARSGREGEVIDALSRIDKDAARYNKMGIASLSDGEMQSVARLAGIELPEGVLAETARGQKYLNDLAAELDRSGNPAKAGMARAMAAPLNDSSGRFLGSYDIEDYTFPMAVADVAESRRASSYLDEYPEYESIEDLLEAEPDVFAEMVGDAQGAASSKSGGIDFGNGDKRMPPAGRVFHQSVESEPNLYTKTAAKFAKVRPHAKVQAGQILGKSNPLGLKADEIEDLELQELFKNGDVTATELRDWLIAKTPKINIVYRNGRDTKQGWRRYVPEGVDQDSYFEIHVSRPGADYQSEHFSDIEGHAAHIRGDVQAGEGGSTLVIRELQSDYKRDLRKLQEKDGEWERFLDEEERIIEEEFGGVEPWAEMQEAEPLAEPLKVEDMKIARSSEMIAVKAAIEHAVRNGMKRIAIGTGDDAAKASRASEVDANALARAYKELTKKTDKHIRSLGGGPGNLSSPPDPSATRGFLSGRDIRLMPADEAGSYYAGTSMHPTDGELDVIVRRELEGYSVLIGGDRLPDTLDDIEDARDLAASYVDSPASRIAPSGTMTTWEITPDMKRAVFSKGQTMYQKGGDARARIRFPGDVETTEEWMNSAYRTHIEAYKSADGRSFMHELGHLWRESLRATGDNNLAKAEELISQYVRDPDTLRNADGSFNWNALAVAPDGRSTIPPDYDLHEAFADAVMEYGAAKAKVRPTNTGDDWTDVMNSVRNLAAASWSKIRGTAKENEVAPEVHEFLDALIGENNYYMRNPNSIATALDAAKFGSARLLNRIVEDLDSDKVERAKELVLVKRWQGKQYDMRRKSGDPDASFNQAIDEEGFSRWQAKVKQAEADAVAAGKKPPSQVDGISTQVSNTETLQQFQLPDEIAKDISARYDLGKQLQDPAGMNKIMQVYDSFLSVFKTNVTATNPGFHSRNFVSGFMQNAMNDIFDPTANTPWDQIVKPYRESALVMRGEVVPHIAKDIPLLGKKTDAEATKEAERLAFAWGVVDSPGQHHDLTGASTQYVADAIPGAEKHSSMWSFVKDRAQRTAPEQGTWSKENLSPLSVSGGLSGKDTFVASRYGRAFGDAVENAHRLGGFLALMKQGYSPGEAAKRIKMLHVDYGNLSDTERVYLRRVFPFYSYSKGMVTYLGQELTQRPGGPIAQTIRAANLSREISPGTPDYVGQGVSLPLGTDEDGTRHYLSGMGLMHEQPVNLLDPLFAMDPQASAFEIGSNMSPAPKAVLETMFNESMFQTSPQGGRSLDDLDPLVGRTLSNVGNTLGLTDRKTPYKLPKVAETIASNSPFARYLSTTRQTFDPRKSISQKMLPHLSGGKISTISPAAQDAVLRERASQLMRDLGGKVFERSYIPQDALEDMSPKVRAQAEEYQELMRMLGERAKQRKAINQMHESQEN